MCLARLSKNLIFSLFVSDLIDDVIINFFVKFHTLIAYKPIQQQTQLIHIFYNIFYTTDISFNINFVLFRHRCYTYLYINIYTVPSHERNIYKKLLFWRFTVVVCLIISWRLLLECKLYKVLQNNKLTTQQRYIVQPFSSFFCFFHN